jgi:hypothetical protein
MVTDPADPAVVHQDGNSAQDRVTRHGNEVHVGDRQIALGDGASTDLR